MFVILPLIWIVAWVAIGGVIAAFSGLAPQDGGLLLFLAISGGGGVGLPLAGALGWMLRERRRNR